MSFQIPTDDAVKARSNCSTQPVNTVTATAPREIWIQVSDDAGDCETPFPPPNEDVTWSHEPELGCEAHYIRADLVAQPDRHALQAAGTHPAPCARHCEARAFEIEIRGLRGDIGRMKADADRQRGASMPNSIPFDPTVVARTRSASPNPAALEQLARDMLNPEELGYAVTSEVRDRARVALGSRPVESDSQIASYGGRS